MKKNVKESYFYALQSNFSESLTKVSKEFAIFGALIHFNRFRLVFKRLKGTPSQVVRPRDGEFLFYMLTPFPDVFSYRKSPRLHIVSCKPRLLPSSEPLSIPKAPLTVQPLPKPYSASAKTLVLWCGYV